MRKLIKLNTDSNPDKFTVYTEKNYNKIPQLSRLSAEHRFTISVVASVLPFRVNNYVLDHLIDWNKYENDPVFLLTFPQKGMLSEKDYLNIAKLIRQDADKDTIAAEANRIRLKLNPHPAGQMQLNIPFQSGEKLDGIQHKYGETVLFFPSQGQVCHSYCTFCFRWAQFIGDKELQFAAKETQHLEQYVNEHKEVTDILITGGDPLVMKTKNLQNYIEPIFKKMHSIRNIRIGTKALSFWPMRFISDPDADDLLRLFEQVVNSGRHLSIMAHFNHWQELESEFAHEAIRRIRDTGAQIRSQAPLLANINDNAAVWARLWETQVSLGIVPYYMFVERDTGAKRFFEVPLYRAWEIYRNAIKSISGIARTARGPSMSAGPGKIEIQGVSEIQGEKVFVLRFIQGRNSDWVQKPFFAKYSENAYWLDDLTPAFGENRFFFENEYEKMKSALVSA